MNSLDATITKVEEPYWDEEYQTYRVKIEYDCWGHISKTERWEKTLEKAQQIKVGDTITV